MSTAPPGALQAPPANTGQFGPLAANNNTPRDIYYLFATYYGANRLLQEYRDNPLVLALQGRRIGHGIGPRGQPLKRDPGPVTPYSRAHLQSFSPAVIDRPEVQKWRPGHALAYLEGLGSRPERETLARKLHRRANRRRGRHRINNAFGGFPYINRDTYDITITPVNREPEFVHILNFYPPRVGWRREALDRNRTGIVYLTPTFDPEDLHRLRLWLDSLNRFTYLVIGRITTRHRISNNDFDLRAYFHGARARVPAALQGLTTVARQVTIMPRWSQPLRDQGSWTLRQVSLRSTHPHVDRRYMLHLIVGMQNNGTYQAEVVAVFAEANVRIRDWGMLIDPQRVVRRARTFIHRRITRGLTPRRSVVVGPSPDGVITRDESVEIWNNHVAARAAHYVPGAPPNLGISITWSADVVEYSHHEIYTDHRPW